MTQSDTILFLKGLQLNNRILDLSSGLEDQKHTSGLVEGQKRLVLSFDLYCLLTEYFVLLNHYHNNHLQGGAIDRPTETIEELFHTDDLIVESGGFDLNVKIDFNAPPNTLRII